MVNDESTAVQKGLAVVEALSRTGGPHRLSEISAQSGLPKGSVHRVLQDLTQAGFAAAHGQGRYGPGPRLRGLASELAADEEGRGATERILRKLRDKTGYTVHVGVRSGTEAVYLYKIESNRPYQMSSSVGMRLPLHCTAIGKVILASLPTKELSATLDLISLTQRTANTFTRPEDLLTELKLIAHQGFAIDDEENETNVRCVGAGVADRNGTVRGVLSVSDLAFELTQELAQDVAPLVRSAAIELGPVFCGGA
jgi:IclR family acetate operon transcriptional repressor